MSKLFIPLQRKEFEALFRLAENEYRDPHQQAAAIIHKELVRCGLLPAESEPLECQRYLPAAEKGSA